MIVGSILGVKSTQTITPKRTKSVQITRSSTVMDKINRARCNAYFRDLCKRMKLKGSFMGLFGMTPAKVY